MRESQRTLAFVGAAVASVGLALLTAYMTRPAPLAEFVTVGEPFYPEFQNPNDAQGLQVIAFDDNTASIKEFQVVFKDGLWRIPSHHNYPADAQDRLANTAASMIGIERGTLVGRRDSDHERFGVIDPLDETATSLKGRGHRVTLTQANGRVLADYIIGKRYEPTTPTRDAKPMYYVRLPKQKEVYLTQLDIDLSTKFSDWIKADLLEMQREDLREVVIDNYSVDEGQRKVVNREINRLTRDKSFDPWKLEGLNDAEQEVDSEEVRKLIGTLDELKIVGVRPKPEGLGADLKVDQNIIKSQLQLDLLIDNLANKGFPILPGTDGKPELIAKQGELVAATDKGIVYTLRFGEIFTGSEFEIETGLGADGKEVATATDGDKPPAEAEKPADASAAADAATAEQPPEGETPAAETPKKNDLQKNRYLFVSAAFDPAFLGPQPVKPEEPQKPAAAPADAAAEQPAESSNASATATDAQNPTDGAAQQPASEATEPPSDAAKAQAEYEAAHKKYEADLMKYEADLKTYDEKVKEGEKQAKALNARFGDWYYVISAENFETMRPSRDALVKAKEKKPAEGGAAGEATNPVETSTAAPEGEAAGESAPAGAEPAAPQSTADPAPEGADSAAPEGATTQPQADPAATPSEGTGEPAPGEEPAAPSNPTAP